MREFTNIDELATDNILKLCSKYDYWVSVEEDDEYRLGLQDDGCLEDFLKDVGVKFINNDDEYYYYKLNEVSFKAPYFKIEDEFEEDLYDSYILFDSLEVI